MSASVDLDEVYGLLTQLCEQRQPLSDEALLCVMEAFNDLAELHLPGRLSQPALEGTGDRLGRSLQLLDALVDGSKQLQRTLHLVRVRRLVRRALEVEP